MHFFSTTLQTFHALSMSSEQVSLCQNTIQEQIERGLNEGLATHSSERLSIPILNGEKYDVVYSTDDQGEERRNDYHYRRCVISVCSPSSTSMLIKLK